jgi:hypothetical protein
MALGDWLRLLRERRFAIAPSSWPRALAISAQSLPTSLLRRYESWRYGSRLKEVTVESPLFVLGHWRQGTTHLHNLLAADRRFAFPNNYQACFPHTFLSSEAISARWIGFFMPRRRPMDNVAWDMESPQEDEFALCVATGMSPCMGWVFPAHRELYDRFLTLHEMTSDELEAWKAAFDLLLRKLTWKYGRPLVLKSPPHTGRIRLLIEMFPDARFVHVHRDPFAVFQSSRRTFLVNFEWQRLERPRLDDLDDWILRQYREMYDAFFAERDLIPAGRFHELRFEDLEKDPVGQLRATYEALGLPDFAVAAPAVETYVASLAGYRRNTFPELPGSLRQRIAQEWKPCFEAWGYPT